MLSRPILAALALLALPMFAFAQAGDTPSADQQDPKAAYTELSDGFAKAIAAWNKKGRPRGGPEFLPLVEKAQALALEYAGEDSAIGFHGLVLMYGFQNPEGLRKSLLTLTMDHATSPAMI